MCSHVSDAHFQQRAATNGPRPAGSDHEDHPAAGEGENLVELCCAVL